MAKKKAHLMIIVLFFASLGLAGQMVMPDRVSPGQTRHYYVWPGPGSIYTWRINGVVQSGFTTNEFIHTWYTADTFLLEVQEISSFGCAGPVRSGLVIVNRNEGLSLIIYDAFSPNGDLINDKWYIGNTNMFPGMVVTVFNRWGQLVWKSGSGYPLSWDGRSNGKLLPVDSYHYIIDLHDGTHPLVGTVTIVR